MSNNSIKIIVALVIIGGIVGGVYAYKSSIFTGQDIFYSEEKNIENNPLISTTTENLVNDPEIKTKPAESKPTVTNTPADSNFIAKCKAAGGAWSDHYGGCLGVEYSNCDNIGGKFDACASNCSTTPDGDEVCTNGCLRVCRAE